jgi:hypothetical protein
VRSEGFCGEYGTWWCAKSHPKKRKMPTASAAPTIEGVAFESDPTDRFYPDLNADETASAIK